MDGTERVVEQIVIPRVQVSDRVVEQIVIPEAQASGFRRGADRGSTTDLGAQC